MDTKSFWRKFTALGKNMTFRDKAYSPDEGKSLWESCPQLAALDPSVAFSLYDDFYQFVPNNSDQVGWVATKVETGAGDAAITIDDAAGGVLKIVNDAADDDSVELQWNAEQFKLIAGKPLWFETRIKTPDAANCDFLIGLATTDTTLITGTNDAVAFRKDNGDYQIDLVTKKDGTTTLSANAATLSNAYINLGFVWDGVDTVRFFVNGVEVGSSSTNIVDDEELAVSIAFRNGAAAAKTIYVDYVKVVQIR